MRCVECGAKNTDDLAERCRLCGGLLPDASQRRVDRLGAITSGPAFNALVEREVETWKELEQRTSEGPKSRRPTEDGDGKRRWGRRRSRDS